jgi:hypothetical protein
MNKNTKYIEKFNLMDNAKNSMKDFDSKKVKKKLVPEKKNGFFQKVSKGGSNLSNSFLGPTHNYAKEILSPQEMGMSDKGNMSTLANNVAGIISYTDVLVSGKSRAQHNSEFSSSCDPGSGRNCAPLGNAFYLQTGGKCKDKDGKLRTRYMYINNKPTGAIPFISNMSGKNLPGLRGLIPGAIENLGHINPLSMFSGFMQGSNPKCRILKLKGEGGNGRQHVADADIADLDPCYWDSNGNPRTSSTTSKSGRNPVAYEIDPKGSNAIKTAGCPTRSGFVNMNKQFINKKIKTVSNSDNFQKIDNSLDKTFNLIFGGLLIYLMYKGMEKSGQLN